MKDGKYRWTVKQQPFATTEIFSGICIIKKNRWYNEVTDGADIRFYSNVIFTYIEDFKDFDDIMENIIQCL